MGKYLARTLAGFLFFTNFAIAQELPQWQLLPPDSAYSGMSMKEFFIRMGMRNGLDLINRYGSTEPKIVRVTKKTANIEASIREAIKPYTSFENKKDAKVRIKFDIDPVKIQSNLKIYNDYASLYGYADYYIMKTGISSGGFNIEYTPRYQTVMAGFSKPW